MSPPAGFDGSGVPTLRARAGLIEDLGRFLGEWRQALERGLVPGAARLAELVQKSADLQSRARAAELGGIAHHLGRLDTEARDAPGRGLTGVRKVLSDVEEMVSHARTEVSAARAASPSSRPPPPPMASPSSRPPPPAMAPPLSPPAAARPAAVPAAPRAPAGFDPLEPPRMITHFPGGAEPAAAPPPPPPISAPARGAAAVAPPPELTVGPAGKRGEPAPRHAPEPIAAAAFAPVLPAVASAAAAAVPSSVPPPPPAAEPGGAPNLNVRTMFGLRAFGRSKQSRDVPAKRDAEPPGGSLLGLRRPGGSHEADRSHAPPPLLSSSLPSLGLPAADPDFGGGPQPSFLDDVRRHRESARRETPARGRAPRRAAALRGRRADSGSLGWLYAVVAGFAVLVVGVVVFIVVRHSRAADAPATAASAAVATPAEARSADDTAAPPSPSKKGLPRERLLNDDERFKAMLSQLHGHGGKESPELRALVDEQAALQANMLSQKCETLDPTCVAWKEAQAMLAAPAGPPIKKRERNQSGMRSKWLAGLKLPDGIPIEDDPAVEKIFTYYSDNQVGREKFQSYLFKCGAYRDLIQATLIRYDLPQALLAVVFTESGCEPLAKSPVGAQGLWQLMPETGRGYHLRIIENTLDERQSPLKSTEAAVHFLADLHSKLGAWDLVFAAYNLGPFALLARIHRAGDNVGFWDLVDADMLPDETANYTPTIEAFALILSNLKRLHFAGTQMRPPEVTADLEVPPNTRIGLVARAAATSIREIQRMNLDVLGERAPNIPGVPFAFQVPKTVVWQARETLQDLLAHDDETDVCVPITFDWGRQRFTPEMQAECLKRKQAPLPADPDPEAPP